MVHSTLHHRHRKDKEFYPGVRCVGGCPEKRTRTVTDNTADVLIAVRDNRTRRTPREWLDRLKKRRLIYRTKYAKMWRLTELGQKKLLAFELRQISKKHNINDF